MRNLPILIVILFLFQNCNSYTSRKLERMAKVYDEEVLIGERKYELTISKIDSGYLYDYVSLDRHKNTYSYTYVKSKKRLYFQSISFEYAKFGDYTFKKNYHNEIDLFVPVGNYVDGPGLILFNENFGVLTTSDAWGQRLLFLPTKAITKLDHMILKNINSK